MKRTFVASLLILAFASILLSACGGGGGGGVTPVPQPTTAVLTLSTAGIIPVNDLIEGYEVTIPLPSGVTVKTLLNSSQTGTNVVIAAGQALGAPIIGVYTASTATLPGTVKVTLLTNNPSIGITAGEFCQVNADIAPGNYPTASSFAQPALDSAQGWDSTQQSSVDLTEQLSLSQTAVVN